MKPLYIEPEDFTPKVVLDLEKNVFEISGKSRPENVGEYYEPVVKWFDELKIQKILVLKTKYTIANPLTINFRLVYFNSSSSKMLYDILKRVNLIHAEGVPVCVNWYYLEDDEDILDSGEELSKLSKIPFHFISE